MGDVADDEVSIDEHGRAVIALPAQVDITTAERVREGLLSLVDSGCQQLHLDMSAVEKIDSTGLAVVMAFMATLHRERPEAKVLFDGLSPMVNRILHMFRAQDFNIETEFRERGDD
ncbi:MAG: STAS domain-containing protein [Planctomycetota bacterium]|jgi:anti-anti-sigma factor|nr:STAS domain-containing protein [Planctomycetota bacterium]